MTKIAKGDLLVSGYGLVEHVGAVHCEHLVTINGYHEPITRTADLELAGYVPVWRKRNDLCGSDKVPAGGSLHLVHEDSIIISRATDEDKDELERFRRALQAIGCWSSSEPGRIANRELSAAKRRREGCGRPGCCGHPTKEA